MIIWLASFPRSGNTFLRIIVNKLFGHKTYSIYNDLNDISANPKLSGIVGHSFLDKNNIETMRADSEYYFIKTHDLPGAATAKDRIIYIIRDGREASLSLSRYSHKFEEKHLSFYDIVNGKHFFGNWGNHVDAWLKIKNKNLLVIKFEDLISQTSNAVEKISHFLNMDDIEGYLPDFSHLKSIDPQFFSSGKIDSWKLDITHREHMFFWFTSFRQMIENGYTQDMPVIFNDTEVQRYLKTIKICNQEAFSSDRDALISERTILTSERNALISDRTNLTSERNGLVEKNKRLESQKSDLFRERSELVKERDQLTKKVANLASENKRTNEARVKLVSQSKRANGLKRKLSTKNRDLSRQIDDLTRNHLEIRSERDQLKDNNIEMKTFSHNLKSKIEKQNSNIEYLKDKLSTALEIENQLRTKRNKLDRLVKEKNRALNIIVATMREKRLSTPRNSIVNFILPKLSRFKGQTKKDNAERDNNQLPDTHLPIVNEEKPLEESTPNLQTQIDHLKQSIALLESLRRHQENFLASKPLRKSGWHEINSKLKRNEQLKIVFINDMGFLYGAGIGLRRQVQSFLHAGHKVASIAWLPENLEKPYFDDRPQYAANWQGMHLLPETTQLAGKSREFVVNTLTQAIMANDPDMIIAGNFHGVGWGARAWPIEAIESLHKKGLPVVAYAHDCYWATGACAYPGKCSQYLTGCDGQKCPKAEIEYPSCPKSEIERNWNYKRSVFAGPNPLPIATNSYWTTKFFTEAFNEMGNVHTVHCGLDTELFKPIDKKRARTSLGLPEDGFYIAIGAVNLSEDRKGGKDIDRLLKQYSENDHITWLAFGDNSKKNGVKGFGRLGEEEVCLIFNAADLFVNLAKEEAFGQTLLEASACGCPIVSYNGGGMTDIARDGQNAICAETGNLSDIAHAIDQLHRDPELRAQMGQKAREIVLKEFSLDRQYENWKRFLKETADNLIR